MASKGGGGGVEGHMGKDADRVVNATLEKERVKERYWQKEKGRQTDRQTNRPIIRAERKWVGQ